MELHVAVYVLAVIVSGIFAQWLGWRTKVPPIILLLGLGLLFGPGLRLIHPSHDLGRLYQPLVGVAVALVVCEGGLTLNLRDLRQAGPAVRRLLFAGLPLNWIFGTLAAHWIGPLSWPVAIVVGAILVVTGPTVILPLLRQARLQRRLRSLLKWEAVVNDPIGAMVTVISLQVAVGEASLSGGGGMNLLLKLVPAVAGTIGGGLAAAWGLRTAFHSDQAPEELRIGMLLAGTLGLYACGNLLERDAGLLAATVFGLGLANANITGFGTLARVQQSLTMLVVSMLFIILAADIDRGVIGAANWRVGAFVAALMLVVRPAAVGLAMLGSGFSWRETALLSWLGPRGIIAAAVAGLAGRALSDAGFRDGSLVLPLIFSVITGTVVLQGLSLTVFAGLLGLRSSDRPGLLIVGASPWSLALGSALHQADVPVVLADPSWASLRPARERGIATVAADVLSQRVDEVADTTDIDYVLAATDNDAYNALVCARLAPELGRERVHQLALQSGRLDRHAIPARDWRGKVVSEPGLDFHSLNDMIRTGWAFRLEAVDAVEAGLKIAEKHSDTEKLVLAIRADGSMAFHTPEQSAWLKSGDRVAVFAPPPDAAGPTTAAPSAPPAGR